MQGKAVNPGIKLYKFKNLKTHSTTHEKKEKKRTQEAGIYLKDLLLLCNKEKGVCKYVRERRRTGL
jgi:hypothetical protein